MWNPNGQENTPTQNQKKKSHVPNSRYTNKDKLKPFMRCIECDGVGHFKCTSEKKSEQIKLTFKVEDNLDEFFVSDQDSNIPCTDDDLSKHELEDMK